jgi:hypothetical protein
MTQDERFNEVVQQLGMAREEYQKVAPISRLNLSFR